MKLAPADYILRFYINHLRLLSDFPETARQFKASFNIVRGRRVLNVGCGPTFFDYLEFFGDMPQVYVGSDINPTMFDFMQNNCHNEIAAVKSRIGERLPKISFKTVDITSNTYVPDQKFDWVVAVGVVAALPGEGRAQAVRNIRSNLDSGGGLFTITWHGPKRSEAEHAEKKRYGFDNLTNPTPENLIATICENGFCEIFTKFIKCDSESYGWERVQISSFTAS